MVWPREAALWRNAPGKRPACVSDMRLPELSGAGQEAAPGSSHGLRTRVMRVANLVRVVAQCLVLSSYLSLSPRSRGCGPRQRILRGRPLIPGLVNTHSITDDSMIVLDAMDLEARRIVYDEVHEHHLRKKGKHHGRRGRGRQAFVAR